MTTESLHNLLETRLKYVVQNLNGNLLWGGFKQNKSSKYFMQYDIKNIK